MRITNEDLKKIIKEEIEAVLDEDYSILTDMTPGDALAYIEENLNGRTWVFWDLESIGFRGQITQYGAVAFKIDDVSGPAPTEPMSTFEVNVKLSEETIAQSQREQDLISRADEIHNAEIEAYESEQEVSDEFKFIRRYKKTREEGTPFTVQDMIDYTHYEPTANDLGEKEALEKFVNWFTGLEGQIVSVGHNIVSFDRRRILEEGKRLGVDVSAFEDLDVFDTVKFQRGLFKQIAQFMMEKGDEKMSKFFKETEKEIKGEIVKIKRFNGKLQQMMDVYGPGPDYIQLHTAVDDTKQLVTAFFNIYQDVKELVAKDPEIRDMTRNIRVARAKKEMGIDKGSGFKSRLGASKAISRFRR